MSWEAETRDARKPENKGRNPLRSRRAWNGPAVSGNPTVAHRALYRGCTVSNRQGSDRTGKRGWYPDRVDSEREGLSPRVSRSEGDGARSIRSMLWESLVWD